jgi:hypothetical protein
MGCFVAGTQGWLLTRSRWYESALLLLICFTLFRPGFWLDQLQPPFDARPAPEIFSTAGEIPQGQTLRFKVASQSRAGADVDKLVRLTMRSGQSADERLRGAGVTFTRQGDKVMVQAVRFGSEAAKYGLAGGDEVTSVLVPASRPDRYWLAIPALLLLGLVVALQRRRRNVKSLTASTQC